LLITMLVFALLVCSALPVLAAGVVSVTPSGNGIYTVNGSGFSGVSGVDMVITYDTATLSNPKVTQGSLMAGSMMIANTNVAGSIRLGLVHASGVSGSGPIATVNFTVRSGSSPARVPVVASVKLIDASGRDIGASADSSTSSGSGGGTGGGSDGGSGGGTGGGSGSGTGGGSGSGTGGVPVVGGTVTMPGETPTTVEKEKAELPPPAPEPMQISDKPVAAATEERSEPPKGAAEKKYVPIKSVLEQFRLFKGEKSPKTLVALFNNSAEGIRQEPPVALSDGGTRVKVIIERPSSGKNAPNFALKGAKLESLKMEGDAAWVVEVLPNKGVYEATITMLRDGTMTEIPLTVAPPLPAADKIGEGGKLTEADFKRFLNERGTEKASRFDQNGDGKRDYIDDYIFTANYIVKNASLIKEKAKEQK
jgi:hypothetical protein